MRGGLTTKTQFLEHRIKVLTLGSRNLLLHATRLWIEAVSTMLWTLSFKTACHRYNSMDMDEDRKTPEQKFSGVEFQNFPTVYDTWGCPVFILEAPLQVVPAGLPKWKPRERTGLYLGHSPFNAGSVALLLNTRTGHASH